MFIISECIIIKDGPLKLGSNSLCLLEKAWYDMRKKELAKELTKEDKKCKAS